MAFAESVASIGGNLLCDPDKACFGMEINANHLRPMRTGKLRGVGRPIHAGRSTQVWEVRISDDKDRLICISRCTLAVVNIRDRASEK